jgi:hypothetical protein
MKMGVMKRWVYWRGGCDGEVDVRRSGRSNDRLL